MIPAFEIRPIRLEEIPLLKGFAPKDWNFDLPAFFFLHFGQIHFYPIVAATEGRIAGCANGILNGKVGWLGNIIVREPFRRRGIGYALTKKLVDFFRERGCQTQLLIATETGERLYKKFGFETSSIYEFYSGPQLRITSLTADKIQKASLKHLPGIIALDAEISGEKREQLIRLFHSTGVVTLDALTGKVSGFFLQDFGAGLIVAADKDAGLALLSYKHTLAKRVAVIPERNDTARGFLTGNGFLKTSSAPRMVLGNELDWKPQLVFSRASGYCG